jgi:hypothetical protein
MNLFLAAIAQLLLTLTGAAGEELGLDAKLRVNTAKKRTHSLLRQGREYIKGLVVTTAQAVQARFIALFQCLTMATEPYSVI